MKTKMMLAVSFVTALVLFNGCGGSEQVKTGFLGDYSKLQKESDSSMRYVNQKAVAGYSGFIVEPVVVYFHDGAKSKGKLTAQQLADLTNYLHTKIVEAVEGAGKKVVYQPAAGVARIRVALTDIEKTSAVNMVPQASLLGAGIGGASMEAEVVDSMTGQQIGAVVESGKGSRIPFSNLGDWTAAKSVMDGWAERFQKRLEESR
jgi:hypothetical protein